MNDRTIIAAYLKGYEQTDAIAFTEADALIAYDRAHPAANAEPPDQAVRIEELENLHEVIDKDRSNLAAKLDEADAELARLRPVGEAAKVARKLFRCRPDSYQVELKLLFEAVDALSPSPIPPADRPPGGWPVSDCVCFEPAKAADPNCPIHGIKVPTPPPAAAINPTDRDWPEDFSHENGKYSNTCCECKKSFNGHKRRVVCKECAWRGRNVRRKPAADSGPVPENRPQGEDGPRPTHWVAISDRMPEEEKTVLWCRVLTKEAPSVHSMLDEGFNMSDWTHWRELPLCVEEESK